MASPRLFVSHATNDATFANNFSQDLRQLGADVWLDSSHLGAGDFVARINDALQRSDVFVLVLTPAALASQWVQQEMNAAITREKQGILRAIFVVEAQHCPLGAIPPLWTVYNRYDANNDYSAALYGVADKLGLQVPRAAARANPVSSTPRPPTQEAATPLPPSPTPTPFAHTPTPTPTPAPPTPVSTPTTPAPWSPYPMPISLPHTPVREAPGQPASTLTVKEKRPAHRWRFGFAALATLVAAVYIIFPTNNNGLSLVLAACLLTWASTLFLTVRTKSWRWTLALLVSMFAAIVAGTFIYDRYSRYDYSESSLKIVVAVFSAAAFILPLRISYKGLGKSSRSVASPPPPYAAAAATPLPAATPAPAATTPMSADKPAPSWRRPTHRWIFRSAALATTLGTITLGYEMVNQTDYYPSPPTTGFLICILLPGVFATAFTWASSLLLTLRKQAWRWTLALAASILFAIISGINFGQSITHGRYAAYGLIVIAICSLCAFVLPLRLGLVGLGPKREK